MLQQYDNDNCCFFSQSFLQLNLTMRSTIILREQAKKNRPWAV